MVAGQCGDLQAPTKGPRTAVVYRKVLIHVQPRESESQLVCGRTTAAWASFQEQRWGIVGASGGVALGKIPLANVPDNWTCFPQSPLGGHTPNGAKSCEGRTLLRNILCLKRAREETTCSLVKESDVGGED